MLVGYYLLLESLPCPRTILVVSARYLMDGLVYLLPIAGSNLNPSLIKDTLQMAEIARHVNQLLMVGSAGFEPATNRL